MTEQAVWKRLALVVGKKLGCVKAHPSSRCVAHVPAGGKVDLARAPAMRVGDPDPFIARGICNVQGNLLILVNR